MLVYELEDEHQRAFIAFPLFPHMSQGCKQGAFSRSLTIREKPVPGKIRMHQTVGRAGDQSQKSILGLELARLTPYQRTSSATGAAQRMDPGPVFNPGP